MTVRAPRSLSAGLIAVLALAVAGCGGGGKSGVTTPSGATLVRSGALAFVSLDSDLGSAQWQQVDDLSHKFAGRSKAIALLKKSLAEGGIDYERDVKPALGPEVDLVFVSGGTESSTSVVGLTKPKDVGKFKALIAKANASDPSGDQGVYREVDGWYAVANSQTAIDQALKGDGKALSDDATFTDALGELPDDALVKAYLDGRRLNELIRQASAQSGSSFDLSSVGLDKLEFISAAASAEDDGLRVHGAASGLDLGGEYSSKLLGGVPGDALAFLTFRGGGTTDQLEKLKSNPTVGQALQQLRSVLGITFDELLALLRNEIAFYVRPGLVIPEISLVLETKDQSAALGTLDKLAARVAAFAGGRVTPDEQGGHRVKTIDFGQFAVSYGGLGDKVLITSGLSGFADYGGPGQKLPDSADFKEAQAAAGMPGSTGGFLYLNVKNSITLIQSLAGLAGEKLPADVAENLRPLRSFLVWSAGSGATRTFDAFLEIK